MPRRSKDTESDEAEYLKKVEGSRQPDAPRKVDRIGLAPKREIIFAKFLSLTESSVSRNFTKFRIISEKNLHYEIYQILQNVR